MNKDRDLLIQKKLDRLITQGKAAQLMAAIEEYKLPLSSTLLQNAFGRACNLGRAEIVEKMLNLPGKMSDSVFFLSYLSVVENDNYQIPRMLVGEMDKKGYTLTEDQEAKWITKTINNRFPGLLEAVLKNIKRPLGNKGDSIIMNRLLFNPNSDAAKMIIPLWSSPVDKRMARAILKNPKLFNMPFDRIAALVGNTANLIEQYSSLDKGILRPPAISPGVKQ